MFIQILENIKNRLKLRDVKITLADKIYFNKALFIPMSSQHFDITLNGTILVELTHTTLRPVLHNPVESGNDPKTSIFQNYRNTCSY
mgnify:CR=1 FL=1